MKTIEYLSGPMSGQMWAVVVSAVAIALLGGLLSVPVVLKRLAFIGQGISHAAFGGVGVALVLGLGAATAASTLGFMGVVAAFCIATAIAIALMAKRDGGGAHEDTLIGVFLVGSMALGSLLTTWHSRHGGSGVRSVESLLFGSILDTEWLDAGVAWGTLGVTVLALAIIRRPLLFWMFDDEAAKCFGVRTEAVRMTLMVLLGCATVVAMKLAGAVLATALLVLPGAAAAKMSQRFWPVVGLACVLGLVGVLGGLVASFELNGPPGACVVMALVGIFVLSGLVRRA